MIARSHPLTSGRRNHDAHIGDPADLIWVSRASQHLSLAGPQPRDAALAAGRDSEGDVDGPVGDPAVADASVCQAADRGAA